MKKFIFVILLIFNLLLFYKFTELWKIKEILMYKYNKLKLEYLTLNKNYENILKNLHNINQTLHNYKLNLKNCENKLFNLKENYKICKYKLNLIETISTKNLINNLTKPCNEIFFYLNVTKCLKGKKFNYVCFIYKLKKFYNFKYKEDNIDEIKSFCEFLKDKYGDCEDYSIFFMGLYKLINNTIILAKRSLNDKLELYREGNIIYYLDNAKEFEVNKNFYKFVGVICYRINKTRGHCINVISKYPITYKLKDFILIEPQTGFLVEDKDIVEKAYIIIGEDFYYRIWNTDYWK